MTPPEPTPELRPIDACTIALLERVCADLRAGVLGVARLDTNDDARLVLHLECVGGVAVAPIDERGERDVQAVSIRMCPNCRSTALDLADPKAGTLVCLKCSTNFAPADAHTPASE